LEVEEVAAAREVIGGNTGTPTLVGLGGNFGLLLAGALSNIRPQ
jgi:hypothetical protein